MGVEDLALNPEKLNIQTNPRMGLSQAQSAKSQVIFQAMKWTYTRLAAIATTSKMLRVSFTRRQNLSSSLVVG